MEVPSTRYANADGVHLAYQRYGAGPDVVVVPPLVSNVELFWDHELYRRVLEHVSRYLRVLHFDKRGIGASDRFEAMPTLEQRMSDIVAVMDAEGLERASVMGVSEGGLMAQLFAIHHPERVERLTLLNTSAVGGSPDVAAYTRPSDPQYGLDRTAERLACLTENWGEDPQYLVDWMMPSQSENGSFVRWVGRLERLSATPADFARQVESLVGIEGSGISPKEIGAPTLVGHVAGDRCMPVAYGRYLAQVIPQATYVEFPGEDHFLWVMPNWRDIFDAWIGHVIGNTPPRNSERRFATILFTDLVGSTAAAGAAGDSSWRETLDSHDRICGGVIERHRGRIVKRTGDGLLAVFDAPSSAVTAGAELLGALAGIGLTMRAGLHAGEIEFREDGDLSGAAVNLAARVEEAAPPGYVFVSSTVRELLLGSDHQFVERGDFSLKGFDGTWRLYEFKM
ncbi:MAG TPA: adenylate/guanylate cyclase domain-containing protein [Acidimicrobiales bacterium]|nr:adenylate/guanylate cyclase domain-containing protein [Acidimicrobiales bacterium]